MSYTEITKQVLGSVVKLGGVPMAYSAMICKIKLNAGSENVIWSAAPWWRGACYDGQSKFAVMLFKVGTDWFVWAGHAVVGRCIKRSLWDDAQYRFSIFCHSISLSHRYLNRAWPTLQAHPRKVSHPT